MNRAYTFAALILVVFLPLASAGELSADDFAVWRIVLTSALPKQPEGTVYVWRTVERSEVYDYGAMQGFRSPMRQLTDQLFRTYNERNDLRPPIELPNRFKLSVPVTLFGQEDAQRHLGRHLNPGWWLHPSRLPGACLVARLSLPAYSRDRTTAFVFAALYSPARADQTYFIPRRTRACL